MKISFSVSRNQGLFGAEHEKNRQKNKKKQKKYPDWTDTRTGHPDWGTRVGGTGRKAYSIISYHNQKSGCPDTMIALVSFKVGPLKVGLLKNRSGCPVRVSG